MVTCAFSLEGNMKFIDGILKCDLNIKTAHVGQVRLRAHWVTGSCCEHVACLGFMWSDGNLCTSFVLKYNKSTPDYGVCCKAFRLSLLVSVIRSCLEVNGCILFCANIFRLIHQLYNMICSGIWLGWHTGHQGFPSWMAESPPSIH